MSIIVNQIKLGIDCCDDMAIDEAKKHLKQFSKHVIKSRIFKKAVDARRKSIYFIYSVIFELDIDEQIVANSLNSLNVSYKSTQSFTIENIGNLRIKNRPCICGFGPAGMFAGLVLSRMGYNPIIIERGHDVDRRVNSINTFFDTKVLDNNTNIQFGEGGAGTFSDGKLNTRINDPLCKFVLDTFVKHGAPDDILYLSKPHIGTDILRNVVKNIRQEIIENGGEVHFDCHMTDVIINKGKLEYIDTDKLGRIKADILILSTGHSSRDTYEMLLRAGFSIAPKAFSVGFRIEHLQKDIDKALYKDFAGHKNLKPSEYQLVYKDEINRACYTFCMCPGGDVVAATSEYNGFVTNGMSNYKRDGQNANSAVVVSVSPEDFETSHPLKGMYFQRKLENFAFLAGGKNYCAPICKVGDYLKNKVSDSIGKVRPSIKTGVSFYDLNECLPLFINNTLKQGLLSFEKSISGFCDDDAVLTGIETRTSAPVRILRNGTFEALSIGGVYPCGEGAGYAGGIMSAAVDGIKVSLSLIKRFSPLNNNII